jgi:1-acyl-sn-glycerol-3-phosphate acyltransferase
MSDFGYRNYHRLFKAVAPVLLNMEVRGLQHIPETGPVILVGNHLSSADPPILTAFVKRHPYFMIKKELYNHLFYRIMLPPMDPIPVERGKADRVALRAAEAVLKRGDILVIYPEGTRSRSGEIQTAHTGVIFLAQRTGAPIVPVAISGSERMLSSRFPWYRRARVQLTFGAPFRLADLQTDGKQDREALAHAVMARVAALLPPRYRGVYAEAGDRGWGLGAGEPAQAIPVKPPTDAEAEPSTEHAS